MAFSADDMAVGGQLWIGAGLPGSIGLDSKKINGSAFIEGPLHVGQPSAFGSADAALLVGKLTNDDASTPQYSIIAKGDIKFDKNLYVTSLTKSKRLEAQSARIDTIRGNSLRYGSKSFEIDHPTKPGKKLLYGCLEGPEHAVYYRGRLKGRDAIDLPPVWTALIDPVTITVSITPVGAHQDIIVKRIGDNKVYLQSKGGFPIDCFFHVFAERKDVKKLVTEVDADGSD
jgi:hypothetical protein